MSIAAGNTVFLSDPAPGFWCAGVNCNGDTGPVSSWSETPLPAALPLFATGIGGLGLLGWRRKRKTQGGRLINGECVRHVTKVGA